MSARARASRELDDLFSAECGRDSDIFEHLPTLRAYAQQCESVTEFGVRGGVSTTALLAGRPRRLHCYDLEMFPQVANLASLAERNQIEFRFFRGDVLQNPGIDLTDLLFIDTWHCYDQLRRELELHAPHVRKYIILHDTMTFGWRGEDGQIGNGLLTAVYEFLERQRDWRIREIGANCHGLTVLERRVSGGTGLAAFADDPTIAGNASGQQGGEVAPYEHFVESGPQVFPASPTVGLVLPVHGEVSFIHLHLETRRRLYPQVPVLLHQAGNACPAAARDLATEYGVECESDPELLSPARHEASALLFGLRWARQKGIQLLVKMNPRFVPRVDWTADLSRLAQQTQAGTYGSWERTDAAGLRTECVAIAVESWIWAGVTNELVQTLLAPLDPAGESVVQMLAKRVAGQDSLRNPGRFWHLGLRPVEIDGYVVWPFVGFDRRQPSSHHL